MYLQNAPPVTEGIYNVARCDEVIVVMGMTLLTPLRVLMDRDCVGQRPDAIGESGPKGQ